MTEENKNLNPQAEGSNTASGSSKLGTTIEEIFANDSSDCDSNFDYDFDSDSSDEELAEELAKKIEEYNKLIEEWEALTKEVTKGIEKYENLKRKRNKEEEKEWQEIIKKHEKTIKQREREKELKNEIISYGKGKGKEVRKEVEAAQLETSLVSWINEGKEQKEAQIETQGVSKGGAALTGTLTGGVVGIYSGFLTGAIMGTATIPIPGIGTATGAIIGTIVGICGGTAVGAGTAALIINSDEKTIRAQTKKQLEEIVLTLTKSQQEQKTNLIKYLTIVKEKMNEKDEELEKVKSENKGLIGQLNTAKSKAKSAEEELKTEKEKAKQKEQESKEREKKEKEQETEIKKRKGEIQNALQSAERIEINKLREESQKANQTTEKLRENLKEWIKAYEEKELSEQLAIAGMEEIFSVVKQRNATIDQRDAEIEQKAKDIGTLTIQNARLETDIVGLQGNIKTQKIEIKNLTNSRDTARNERNQAREEVGKLEQVRIQLTHDKKKAEEARDEAVRTMESLGYPKWFKRSTDFLGVESANQIWGKGVFLGRFALLLLIGAFLFYIGSWVLRILVGIFKNLKAIFTKKQNTAEVLKEMLTGMKEAKDSVVNKVKRVKKAPVEEVKEVEIIEEENTEKNEEEKSVKGSKNGKKAKKQKKGKK